MVQSVHTVTLDEPLLLLINLKYCRSTEGVLIHKPANMTNLPNTGKVIAEALKSTFEGFLDDEGSGDASVFLTDTVGQRLRLNIQNSLGGGGQRHIMIYCPYWIINTSQFSVRIREDGDVGLPAGTVTSQRNGTRPVADADIERSGHHFQTIRDPVTGVEHEIGERTLFPGQIGPLHNLVNSEIQEHSELNRLLHPLPFEELVDKSYLFNYKDDSRVLGSKRTVSVQLDDSEWSVPFSLDTAGVNQSAVIESACGTMEIGIRTELAPGKLAKLTKIVRFSPKFVATNDLPTTIELVQASGVGVGDTSSVQISPGYRKPFHLPALFGERIVSLKVHGPWKTSVPFEIDHVGTYTINIPRRLDLSSLHHVQTRGAAEYSVLFPSVEEEAEIGIWFETDWAVKECVVKSIKSGLFAATQTEIQLGDVVLAIDGEDVHSLPFDTIMQKMKSQRMRPVGTTVTFRTVEEKLRIIRMDAVSSNRHGNQHNKQLSKGAAELAAGEDGEGGLSSLSVRVDLRNVESSLFLHLSLADPEVRADYRIENNSCSHVIHYKQKNVPGIRWAELMPGKSANYVWDDPFQPHRLLIRSGRNIFDPERGAMFTMVKMWNSLDKNTRDKHSLSTRIGNSDPYVMGMHFDEMNKTENLPLPNSDAVLPMVVTSDGPTKVLRVSPPAESARRESIYSVSLLTEEVYILEVYEKKIENLLRVFDTTAAYDKHDALDVENTTEAVEDDLGVTPQLPKMLKRKSIVRRSAETTRLMIAGQMAEMLKDIREAIAKHKLIDDNSSSKVGSKFGAPLPLCAYSPVDSPLGPIIENEHGLMVEVLEARDLRSSSSLQGDRVEDVFCKVYVKSPDDGLTRVSRKYMLTYLSDRTMDPLWFGQKFIFDVPEKASLVNRGFFIRIIVKYTTVFGTKFMGQADVPLSGLLSEEAVCGWFPLRGKDSTSISTRRTTDVSLGNFGSIRLRLQWVFTDAGLVKHTLTELRLRKHELEDHLAVRRAYLRAENDKDMMNRRRIAKNGVSTRFKENSHGKQSTRDIVSPLPLPRTLDTPVRRSVTKKKSMEKFDEVNIRTSSSTPRRSSTLGIKTKFVGAMKNRKSMFSINTNLSAGDYDMKVNVPPRTKRASVIVPMRQTMHDQLIMQWAKCLKRISEQKIAENGNYIILDDDNKPIQSVLRRKDSVHNDNLLFLKRADEECNRSYHHVHSTTGTLEITAIQALQLPDPKHPLHVSINYGDEIQTTHSMPAASDLTFVHVESLSEDVDVSIADRGASGDSLEDNAESVEAPPRSEAFTKLTKLFKMDLLNVKGSIRVKIVAERFPKNVDVAVLDIPVFNLLDNICTQDRSGGSCYDRWFALVLSSEFVPSEGNKADFAKNLQSERTHYAPFGYAPCIRLQFRWKSEAVYNHDVSKFYTRVQLPDFSVSVIDSIHAREIMQLSISGMTVRQFETNAVNDTSVNISMLQVDNQLQLPLAPVIFYPTQFKFPQPVIRYHMRKSIVNSQPHLKSYETIQLIVQEFDLKLEQQTIVTTWELVQDWLTEVRQSIRMLGNSNEYEGAGDGTETVNDGAHTEHSDRQKNSVTKWFGMPFVPNSEEQSSKTAAPADIDENRVIDKIYVEVFTLMPIKINVSFIMTPQLDAAAGAITGTALANQKMQKDTVSDSSGFGNAVWQFLFQVGEVVLDLTSTVDNAPIMLNGLIVPNLFETEEKLFGILQGHYLNSALRQLYKIAGSLELVGNPIGLMSSLGTGVRDFFFEPGLALISNPTEFRKIGKGVVKGTLSLVSNTADGMISTGTTFTRAAGRGLATLSMDHAFMIARQELQRTPQDIGGWLIRPIRDIRNGVYYGIVGIVRVPYVSIRRYGSSGVIPGVAKGIAGLPAKAVVGILDAATHVGESFTEGMKYLQRETTDPVTRRRLSNLFGPDGRILPFSNTCALGTYLLRVLDQIVREKFSNNVSSAINEGVLFVRSALGPSKGSKNDAKRRGSLTNGWMSSKSGDGADDSSGYKHREGRGSFGHRGSKMFDFYSSDAAVPDAPDPLNTLEMNKEFVIFTAILRKGVNIDQVIVVSSNRVVVVDYRRERGGSFVKLVWQSLLINIRTPLLERNGGGATLKVRTYEEKSTGIVSNKNMQRSNSVHETVSTNLLDRRKSISPQSINSSSATNDYLIVATYQDENTLIQLCNCLNLMIGNFDNIIPSGAIIGDELGGRSDVTTSVSVSKRVVDLEEDDSGVVRIGPWEYSRDNSSLEVRSNTITTAFSNPEVGAILEAAEWIVPTSESDRQSASNWLFKEGLASEAAHLHIRELKLLCEDEELLKSSTSQNFVQLLKDGNVTYDEFKTFYEMEMRNAAELRASQEQQQENCLASAIDLTIDVDDDSSVQTSNNINNYISNTFSNLSASVGQAIKPIAGLMSKNKKKKAEKTRGRANSMDLILPDVRGRTSSIQSFGSSHVTPGRISEEGDDMSESTPVNQVTEKTTLAQFWGLGSKPSNSGTEEEKSELSATSGKTRYRSYSQSYSDEVMKDSLKLPHKNMNGEPTSVDDVNSTPSAAESKASESKSFGLFKSLFKSKGAGDVSDDSSLKTLDRRDTPSISGGANKAVMGASGTGIEPPSGLISETLPDIVNTRASIGVPIKPPLPQIHSPLSFPRGEEASLGTSSGKKSEEIKEIAGSNVESNHGTSVPPAYRKNATSASKPGPDGKYGIGYYAFVFK